MSALSTLPRPAPSQDGHPSPSAAAPTAVEFHYTQTDSFVALLHQLGVSLFVTTYQANKLLVVRAVDRGLSTLVRTFEKPMGLAADGRRLALGTRNQIWFLRNAPDIAPRVEPTGAHDACFLPRSCHGTGDIAVHEMAWARTRGQESGIRSQGSALSVILSAAKNLLNMVSRPFAALRVTTDLTPVA